VAGITPTSATSRTSRSSALRFSMYAIRRTARPLADFSRRPGFAQPQGAGRGRHHDRQLRAQHDAHRAPRRRLPRLRARLRESLKRNPVMRSSRKSSASRNPTFPWSRRRAQSLRSRRIPHLRRFRPDETEALAFQKTGGIGVHRFDMDENYAYISTRWKATWGTSSSSTTSASRRSRRKFRAGGCRGRTLPPEKNLPGRESATGCTTRCASGINCGPAAGTRECA